MPGVTTPNVTLSNFADSIIGNWQGSTRRIPIERLLAMLAALMGPTYATRAELFADRDWPAGSVGYVRDDGNTAFNGVYKKNGAVGSGSWVRIGSLPSGAVETALIDELRSELRLNSGKIFRTRQDAVDFGQENLPGPLGYIVTHEGDELVYRHPSYENNDPLFPDSWPNWGVLFRIPNMTLLAEKADITNSGKIFYSRQNAVDHGQENLPSSLGMILTIEDGDMVIRHPSYPNDDPLFPDEWPNWGVRLRIPSIGRIDIETTWSPDFSGLTVTPGTNTILQRGQDGEVSIWRLRTDPPEPVDTEIHQQDAEGNWWGRNFSLNALLAEIEAIATEIADLGSEVEAGLTIRPTLAEAGTIPYPGDAPGGVYPLAVDDRARPVAGVTGEGKGYFPLGLDMSEGAMPAYPGDGFSTLIESANGTPVIGVEDSGRVWLRGWGVEPIKYPGDDLYVIADDLAGNPVMGLRASDLSLWIAPVSGPSLTPYPGDDLEVVAVDQAGSPVMGYRISTGDFWVPGLTAAAGPDPDPTGSTVEFVDPVTGVQPYMAIQSDGVIRYMDAAKWPGHLIGFEERVIDDRPLAIAQTPDPALGIVAFGGGTTYVQTPENSHPWHILNPAGRPSGENLEAQRAASEFLTASDAQHRPLYSVFAMSEAIGSTIEADALPGSAYRDSIRSKVAAARATAEAFGKSLYIDRIHLSLLEGDRSISQAAADLHYAGVSQDLALELATEAGQGALPVVVVTQGFGDRANGVSNVALAEGRLHWEHWSLAIVCATPRYPFPLVDGMPGLHTPEAAQQIAELQNLAATARLSGDRWYPPSLERAELDGNVITARFSSLTDSITIRDPANHGFALRGDAATITDVSVSGVLATITLSAAPTGTDLYLDYAYGQTGDPGDGYPANRGSITDGWSQPSRHGGTLYRYALSNRVKIIAN